MKVYNADNAILGRLASHAAQDLLKGERVVIVNAEKAIITGDPVGTWKKYKQRVDRFDIANPRLGPMFPRRPDMLVRRAVRGMINYTSMRGTKAFKSLKVYMGTPDEYAGKAESVKGVEIKDPARKHIRIENLSHRLGWTARDKE